MLGLGIDAVRFYEKKGLVHPQVNSKNRYRMYSFYQIMELLDISYYRSLGLSIGQIHQLYESGDEEQLLCLLREKKRETEKKILYEQQLLKRIEHVGSMTARIRERGGEIDITTFPEGYVLFEQRGRTAWSVIWSRSQYGQRPLRFLSDGAGNLPSSSRKERSACARFRQDDAVAR